MRQKRLLRQFRFDQISLAIEIMETVLEKELYRDPFVQSQLAEIYFQLLPEKVKSQNVRLLGAVSFYRFSDEELAIRKMQFAYNRQEVVEAMKQTLEDYRAQLS